jgi:hypothetical protein
MAVFKYLIIQLDGTPPTGTDDLELAKHITEHSDQVWVIDVTTGIVMEDEEDFLEVEEEDHNDWLTEDEPAEEEPEDDTSLGASTD